MATASAYARFSDEGQRPTSIDDQLRRCREIAAREGITIEERLVFSDDAITGKAEGRAKRAGYQRLIDAIEARECSIVIADEISRLTRHFTEGGRLMDYVEQIGVRFITADGIDTDREGWKPTWMAKLMVATMEVESTGSRAIRGMLGQLERGYQIAQAPLGYTAAHDVTSSGRMLGAKWSIYEPDAQVVRRMYAWKMQGESLSSIARMLQAEGVPPPGAKRKGCRTPYWRASAVHHLLSNPIYRGVFIWNNSSFARARARKRRKEVKPIPFQRPDLRLVSDEVWYAVNSRPCAGRKEPAPRGGGKNLFAGMVRCGECQNWLSVGSGKVSKCLYCAQCEQAIRVGGRSSWTGYSSVGAARAALNWALEMLFTGPVRAEFNRRLAERLHTGPEKEEQEVSGKLKAVCESIERIQDFMLNPAVNPAIWQPKLEAAAQEKEALEHQAKQLRQISRRLTPRLVQTQVDTDPLPLLRELLEGSEEVYKARATLRRLLARFEFIRRPRRGVSVFRIALKPGVCIAEMSETEVIDAAPFEYEVTATTTAKRPVSWAVTGHRIEA